jgi:hypothetical protein
LVEELAKNLAANLWHQCSLVPIVEQAHKLG